MPSGHSEDAASPFPSRHRQDGISYLFTRQPALLWACAQLHHQGLPTRLRVAGGAQASGVVGAAQVCPVSARLQALAAQWGFAQGLHITGRVSPQALAQALALNPAQRVRMAHQARRWVETERRFEKLVQPMVDAFNA